MHAAKAFFIPAVTVYKLIHGNIKHAAEFNENTKTWILPFVLDIHNRVGRAPPQAPQGIPASSLFSRGRLLSPARDHENQIYLHNVPYNITQTYFIFKVIVCELNTILCLVVFNCTFFKNIHLTYV